MAKKATGKKSARSELFESLQKCVLTGDEIVERSREMAQLMSEIASDEADLKAVVQEFKSRIAGKEARLGTLARNVQNGFEFRTVQCSRHFNYAIGRVEEFRSDTGERVSQRAMTDEERQQELGFEAE
jgi:vacuolar-type H+-ATPase subunit I/STV1